MIQMSESKIGQIVAALSELMEDSTVPKNVKARVEMTLKTFNENLEDAIKVSKALHQLEEITEDSNIQPYTRTQIWNVISMLEIV